MRQLAIVSREGQSSAGLGTPSQVAGDKILADSGELLIRLGCRESGGGREVGAACGQEEAERKEFFHPRECLRFGRILQWRTAQRPQFSISAADPPSRCFGAV